MCHFLLSASLYGKDKRKCKKTKIHLKKIKLKRPQIVANGCANFLGLFEALIIRLMPSNGKIKQL